MCRPNVQFPFLSSYSKIRAPDTSHRGIWYTSSAVKSKPRYMSLPGPVVMKVVVQGRTVSSMGGLARAPWPSPKIPSVDIDFGKNVPCVPRDLQLLSATE